MSNRASTKIHYKTQYEVVGNELNIFNLLKPVVGIRNSLKVSTSNSDESYTSEFVEINLDRKHIVIRKIGSRLGHEKLLKQKSLNICCLYNGSDINFSTSLIGLTGINNGEYIIKFPKKLEYLQRRNAHRVHISLATSISACFINSNGEQFEGQLRDISTEGMRVQFSRIPVKEFENQSSFSDCKIVFPDNDDIRFEFNVCHLQQHSTKKGCTIGGNFQELEIYQKRTIEKFIAALERKALRSFRI